MLLPLSLPGAGSVLDDPVPTLSVGLVMKTSVFPFPLRNEPRPLKESSFEFPRKKVLNFDLMPGEGVAGLCFLMSLFGSLFSLVDDSKSGSLLGTRPSVRFFPSLTCTGLWVTGGEPLGTGGGGAFLRGGSFGFLAPTPSSSSMGSPSEFDRGFVLKSITSS